MIGNFLLKNHAIYEIMWRNIVESGRPQWTIWHMRIACWISKITYTHSEYVLLTTFFHCNNGCMNAPQCYIICTLPVLLRTVKIKGSKFLSYVCIFLLDYTVSHPKTKQTKCQQFVLYSAGKKRQLQFPQN
jgi:hypothetical protein